MDKDDDGNVFMEVYDRIHSVDLVLRGSDHPKLLEIYPNKLISMQLDGKREIYPLVVEIEPSSCTSIQKHENEGIGVRLQLRDSNPEPQTGFLSTSVRRVGGQIEQMENGICQCRCKTCGLPLFVNKVKFNRILPLPSQTWREMFNNWSCCSHFHDKEGTKVIPSYVTQNVIRPREKDCLLSEFQIMVHSNIIKKENIFVRKSQQKDKTGKPNLKILVGCSRCRANLGEAHKFENKVAAFGLNKSCVEVLSFAKENDNVSVSEFFLERLLAQQLSNAVLAHTTHLFIIQDHKQKTHLLIRVLNTNTRLFINNGNMNLFEQLLENKPNYSSSSEDESCQPFKPLDHTSHRHCGSGDYNHNQAHDTGQTKVNSPAPAKTNEPKVSEVISNLFSFSTHLLAIGGTSSEIRSADITGCERIVKVMYASTATDSIKLLSEKWLKDERTLTLTYPTHICVQMLLVLLSSTLTMPVAHRVIDDFVVGFLRLD